jgi:TolA-binding protein
VVAVRAAEPTKMEQRLFAFGQKAMEDHLYELAENQFEALLAQYPESELCSEAACLLAQALLKQGRWIEAREVLQARLLKVPTTWQDTYYFWIGEALLSGEMHADAYKTYEQIVLNFQKSRYLSQARYGMARALIQQGKIDAAQELLKALVKDDNKELAARANLSLGISFFLQKKYEQATELLGRLAKEERNTPTGFMALYSLGEVDLELKKIDAARQRFETLTRSERSEAQAVVPPAFAHLAEIETSAGNWPAAANDYEQAFRKSNDPVFRLKCVKELITVYLKLDKAAALADKLKIWGEENAKSRLGEELLLQVATLWQQAGKHDQAILAFQRFLEKYPNGDANDRAHLQLGCVYQEDRKYELAISEFQRAGERARTPSMQAEALLKTGDIQFERQQYDAAVQAYARSAQVKGADPVKIEQALYQAANASFLAGNLPDVFKYQQICSTDFPNGKLAPEFLVLLAETHRKKNDIEKVAASFKALIDRFPASPLAPEAWLGYAKALLNLGKCKESIEAIDQFVKANSKSELMGRAIQLRARNLERLGQMDKAVAENESLVKAYARTPIGIEAQFWLGAYYQRQRNYARAQEQFELLLKNAPTNLLAPEATFFAAQAAYKLGQKPDDALRLIERLVKDYAASPWVFDARLLYADILTERSKFPDALLVLDDLVKNYDPAKNPELQERILDVQGRRGQILRQLQRFPEAVAAFKIILDAPRTRADPSGASIPVGDAADRNHTCVELGKTYENMQDPKKALESYLAPLYERNPQSARPDECEFFWIGKGGFEAARLLEEQKNWKGAASVWSRLAESNLPCSKEAAERLKKLKSEHSDAN